MTNLIGLRCWGVVKMIDDEFDDPNELWVDDLYDMDEAQLRREIEQYARLARRYPHPTSRHNMAYQFAYLRHSEAMKILEARSQS
jgi:hypothetical protein